MCNQAPAHLSLRNQDPVPCPPSLSSDSQAVYYGDAATQGQMHRGTNNEEEVVPEDSASTRVFPTHGLTKALEVLALAHDGTLTKEDVVMNHAQPEGFEEALQSFRTVPAELDGVLADDDNGELDVSRQLGRRKTGPPKTLAEEALREVFMEQGITGPSTITEYEARAGPLPLEDDESAVMSSLDDQGIPQRVDYVAFGITTHEKPRRDRHSVSKGQHYCRPFARTTLHTSRRSHDAVRSKKERRSDKSEDIDELAE